MAYKIIKINAKHDIEELEKLVNKAITGSAFAPSGGPFFALGKLPTGTITKFICQAGLDNT